MTTPADPTPAVTVALVTATRAGLPRRVAAEMANVPAETFRRWLDRGRAGRSPACVCLHRRVVAATPTGPDERFRQLERASKRGYWRATAYLLEWRFPADFGDPAARRRRKQQR